MTINMNDFVSGMYAAHFDEQDALEAARRKRHFRGKVGLGLGALGLGAAAVHTGAFPDGAQNFLTNALHGAGHVASRGADLVGRVLDSTEDSLQGGGHRFPGQQQVAGKSSSARPEIKEDEEPTRLGRLASAFF